MENRLQEGGLPVYHSTGPWWTEGFEGPVAELLRSKQLPFPHPELLGKLLPNAEFPPESLLEGGPDYSTRSKDLELRGAGPSGDDQTGGGPVDTNLHISWPFVRQR